LGFFRALYGISVPKKRSQKGDPFCMTSQQFLPFIAQAHWPLVACQPELNSLQQGDNDYPSYTIWLFNIAMENHHF
jgi:hypothetical protein